jgi:AcrR family transcriptional regulator
MSHVTWSSATVPHAVTVDRIIDSSGAPKGSIYHRFSTVDDLLAAMWIRAVRRSQAAFLAELANMADRAHPIPARHRFIRVHRHRARQRQVHNAVRQAVDRMRITATDHDRP